MYRCRFDEKGNLVTSIPHYKIGYIKRGRTRNWQYITFSDEILAMRWLFENLGDCVKLSYKVVTKQCR